MPASGFLYLHLQRIAPEDGVVLYGMHFEEGTVAGTNPAVIHQGKTTFGDDVDEFRAKSKS